MIYKVICIALTLIFLGCAKESKFKKKAISKELQSVKDGSVKRFNTLEEAEKAIQHKMLVNDIINPKNVRSFFIAYGRKNPETRLLLKTRLGNVYITLYKQTPLHRASFIYLIKNGYYNKTCFHRIVKDFIVQAGWSDNPIVDEYRRQLNQYKLPPEFRKDIQHKKGALAASRRWLNNPGKLSSPFEFYILQTTKDCSHLDFEHTVFGQVTKGFDVIDKIANLKLDAGTEWPEVNVEVEFVILK